MSENWNKMKYVIKIVKCEINSKKNYHTRPKIRINLNANKTVVLKNKKELGEK